MPQSAEDNKKPSRIKMAEVAFAATAIVLIFLTLASHYTNFTQPLPPPGAEVVTATSGMTMATILFIVGTGLAALIALSLEVARRNAQKKLESFKTTTTDPSTQITNPNNSSSASPLDMFSKAIRENIGNVEGLAKLLDGVTNNDLVVDLPRKQNAFHLLASTVSQSNVKASAVAAAAASGAQDVATTALKEHEARAKAVIEELLKHANKDAINAQDADGNTALHIARKQNNKAVYNALLATGANANIKDASGNTPTAPK